MNMRKLNFGIFILAIVVLIGTSCNKDDLSPVLLTGSSIITENFTGSTILDFSYSIDNGVTWSLIFPNLTEGTNLMVKVVSGVDDLTNTNYDFDWSSSNPLPEDVRNDIALFMVGKSSMSLKVAIFELICFTNDFTSDYSGDGTIAFSFSLDDGENWYTEAPTRLHKGSNVMVKVTDGNNDLTTEEFEFDWSGSSLQPSDTSADIAIFDSVIRNFNITTYITEIEELVVIARADGKLYLIDQITGFCSEIGAIVDASKVPISGLRALNYDPYSGKCFLGSTADNNGKLYSLDIKTGLATLLNDNSSNDHSGISGLLTDSDGNVLANLYSNILNNSAVTVFNSITGDEGVHNKLGTGDVGKWSSGGLIFGYSNEELIFGGHNEIYFTNLTATVSKTVVLDNPSYVLQDSKVMDLARYKNTTEIYSIMLDVSNSYLHLVKMDVNSGKVSWINSLADNNRDNWFHCLAFIPKHRLPNAN